MKSVNKSIIYFESGKAAHRMKETEKKWWNTKIKHKNTNTSISDKNYGQLQL